MEFVRDYILDSSFAPFIEDYIVVLTAMYTIQMASEICAKSISRNYRNVVKVEIGTKIFQSTLKRRKDTNAFFDKKT